MWVRDVRDLRDRWKETVSRKPILALVFVLMKKYIKRKADQMERKEQKSNREEQDNAEIELLYLHKKRAFFVAIYSIVPVIKTTLPRKKSAAIYFDIQFMCDILILYFCRIWIAFLRYSE